MVAIIKAEKLIIIGMQGVAVVVAFVIDNLLKIGDCLVPLAVEKIDLAAQSVSRSLCGASEVGRIPVYGEFGDSVSEVVDYMLTNFVGRTSGRVEICELLVYIATLIIIRHTTPTVEHTEISHCAKKFWHVRYITYNSV